MATSFRTIWYVDAVLVEFGVLFLVDIIISPPGAVSAAAA